MKKSGSARSTKASRYWDLKTFTWYIPAPPGHGKGHREKEFDKILHGILASGHEVLEWRLQSVGGGEGGMYAVFLLGSTKKSAMGPQLDLHERFALTEELPADVELLDEDLA